MREKTNTDGRRRGFQRALTAATAVILAGGTVAGATVALAEDNGEVIDRTWQVEGTFDGEGRRFVAGGALGDGGQAEGQEALFTLADGATLRNVVLGSPAADGVHCEGSCQLIDVTWEDVGEDAATFRGADAVVLVEGGSASGGADKIFQDNRDGGGHVTIRNFSVNDFGKLYRSCGTCGQATRTATIQNVTATGSGVTIAGVNANMGDRVEVTGVTLPTGVDVCQIFEADPGGGEPRKIGTEPDGTSCIANDIRFE